MKREKRSGAWRIALRRFRHRLKLSYAWHLRHHDTYQPLFVLATARSGSTLLVDYLRSMAGIQTQGEVLHPQLPIGLRPEECSPKTARRHIQRSLQALRAPIRGCKLMLYHLEQCGLTVEDLQTTFPRAKYVIIYRESLVEQYLSDRAAVTTGQWTVRRGSTPKQAQVQVDLSGLRSFSYCTRRHYDELFTHHWLRDHAALISYEQLVADPNSCFAKHICPLLSLPALEPRTELVKQNSRPLAQRISNFNEVAEALSLPEFRLHYAWPSKMGPVDARAA